MNTKDLFNKLSQIIITLFGISIITFGLVYLAPGDPVTSMYLSSGFLPSQDVIDSTREAEN